MHFSFFSLKSQQMNPLQVPQQGPLWRELPIYRAFIHISQILIKIPLNKENFFPSLKGPRKGASLHVPQNRGPYGNRRPFPDPSLAYPSRSQVEEPPPLQVPLIELAPSERDAHF